jgi:hypothetical protein
MLTTSQTGFKTVSEGRSDMTYYERNKEKIKAQVKAYRLAHPEKRAAWNRAYEQRHPENAPARQKRYRERNPEKVVQWQRDWHVENPEYNRTYMAKRKVAYPVRALLYAIKKRAKQKNLEFSLTPDDIVIPEFCPVLGIKLEVATKGFVNSSPSVDRIRSELGYVSGNVRVVSWRANKLRCDATSAELKLIYEDLLRLGL